MTDKEKIKLITEALGRSAEVANCMSKKQFAEVMYDKWADEHYIEEKYTLFRKNPGKWYCYLDLEHRRRWAAYILERMKETPE